MPELTESNKKSRIFLIYIIIGIGIMVGGVYWFNQAAEDSNKKYITREKLRFGQDLVPMCSLSIIAREKGFFDDQDLDLHVIEYPSGRRAIQEGLHQNKRLTLPKLEPNLLSSAVSNVMILPLWPRFQIQPIRSKLWLENRQVFKNLKT